MLYKDMNSFINAVKVAVANDNVKVYITVDSVDVESRKIYVSGTINKILPVDYFGYRQDALHDNVFHRSPLGITYEDFINMYTKLKPVLGERFYGEVGSCLTMRQDWLGRNVCKALDIKLR